MRVIEPKNLSAQNPSRKASFKRKLLLIMFTFLVVVFGLWFFAISDESNSDNYAAETDDIQFSSDSMFQIEDSDSLVSDVGGYRVFSGNEFRLLYDNLLQPNLEKVEIPPYIFGDVIADSRIRTIAETRGYKLRASPVGPLSSVDGYRMQTPVVVAWQDLKRAALSEGLNIRIVSSYRSVQDQRRIFTTRLQAMGVSISDILEGRADAKIDELLITSSIPGYSKHHTGYTIDILCEGYVFEDFGSSPCYSWISADNYLQAKKHGFIPSYPDDADLQGPDPEAWEYVWVGTDLLEL